MIPLALLLAALDGGALVVPPPKEPPKATKPLSPEDQEVVRMMELLESMNEAQDLELLQDLSLEQ